MKSKIRMNSYNKKRLISLISSFLLACAANVFAANQATFYVSPSGNDNNEGTESAPFKTIERAQKAVRGINSTMSGDIIVYLREGTYQLTNKLHFGNADGGNNGYYVRYMNYPNERPLLTGGVPVTDGWTLFDATKNIWCIKNVDARFRQLYVNNKKAIRARHPNLMSDGSHNFNRLAKVDTFGRAFDVFTDQIETLKNVKKAEIHLMVAWADQILRLDEVKNNGYTSKLIPQDPERTRLFYRKYPMLGIAFSSNPPKQQVYYLENDFNLLDTEGEWYLDETDNTLYYMPRNGEDMNSASVVAPNIETLIDIAGESTKNKVQNIGFKGIVFAHTNYMRPSHEGFLDLQAGQFAVNVVNRGALNSNEFMLWHPNAGVQVTNASRLQFDENNFSFMGGTGLDLISGTNDTHVIGNVFNEIGGSGISVGKFYPDSLTEVHLGYNPSDKDEISTRDTFKNNLVTNVTNEFQGACGISAGYPRYLLVEHNEISYMNYSGVTVGYGWITKETAMTNNRINWNEIHHVARLLCDCGAVYTLSNQGTGSEIQYNYMHDISGSQWADYWILPIYLDEGSSGFNVSHNVSERAPNGVAAHMAGYYTESDNKGNDPNTIANAGIEKNYKWIKDNIGIPIAVFSGMVKLSKVSGEALTAPAEVKFIAETDLENIKLIEFFNGDKKIAEATSAPYEFIWEDLQGGSYSVTAVATDAEGNQTTSSAVKFSVKGPFGGVTQVIPGFIQMENFDEGGYYDIDNINEGKVYRESGVDVVETKIRDYAIGYTQTDEWLEYSVNVNKTAEYNVTATVSAGLENSGFQLFLDGKELTEAITVETSPDESWDTYYDFPVGKLEISEGKHILRVLITGSFVNIDKISFSDPEVNGLDIVESYKVITSGVYEIFDLIGIDKGSIELSNGENLKNKLEYEGFNKGLYILKSKESNQSYIIRY